MKHFAFDYLTRPGCHLCDEARPLVLAAVQRVGGSVNELDIDRENGLVRDYGMRIPVLLAPDGQVIAEGAMDAGSLRRGLRKYGRQKKGG